MSDLITHRGVRPTQEHAAQTCTFAEGCLPYCMHGAAQGPWVSELGSSRSAVVPGTGRSESRRRG
jgi:hypothetical protein